MFSRIFNSARSFVNPQAESKTGNETQPAESPTMATTRNKKVENSNKQKSTSGQGSAQAYVPSSKRKSHEISQDEATSDIDEEQPSKKTKMLPVRGKHGDYNPANTRPVVEIPLKKPSSQPESRSNDSDRPKNRIKHKKFSDEVPGQDFSTLATEGSEPTDMDLIEDNMEVNSGEDDEDSDDAPEEVQTEDAARSAKSKARSAADAVKSLKSKRRERSIKAEMAKRESGSLKEKPVEQFDAIQNEKVAAIINPIKSTALKVSLPELLPEQLLEDYDNAAESPPTETTSSSVKRKTKLQIADGQAPKDRRVGSTTYRVTKTSYQNLAPKSGRVAKRVKESWLQGRSGGKLAADRKSMKQGFFKK